MEVNFTLVKSEYVNVARPLPFPRFYDTEVKFFTFNKDVRNRLHLLFATPEFYQVRISATV